MSQLPVGLGKMGHVDALVPTVDLEPKWLRTPKFFLADNSERTHPQMSTATKDVRGQIPATYTMGGETWQECRAGAPRRTRFVVRQPKVRKEFKEESSILGTKRLHNYVAPDIMSSAQSSCTMLSIWSEGTVIEYTLRDSQAWTHD